MQLLWFLSEVYTHKSVLNRNQMSHEKKPRIGQSESGHVRVFIRDFDASSHTVSGQQSAVIPLAVIEEILLKLPADQVVLVCRLVCSEWQELVDSAAHWRERCRREGIRPWDATRPPNDWRLFYFLTMKRRNLLKNPNADDNLQGWEIVAHGGNGWASEKNRKQFPDDKITKCFATSYRICLKQQLIDLEKEGYSAAFMDQLQPPIKISDWYAPHCLCGCKYEIKVKLLNKKKHPMSTFQPEIVEFEDGNDEPWCQMTHTFKDYGPGVRFICFIHGGFDTRCWKDHYGVRVTNSSVEICPDEER